MTMGLRMIPLPWKLEAVSCWMQFTSLLRRGLGRRVFTSHCMKGKMETSGSNAQFPLAKGYRPDRVSIFHRLKGVWKG